MSKQSHSNPELDNLLGQETPTMKEMAEKALNNMAKAFPVKDAEKEPAIEFLRRAVSWLDMNNEDLLTDLPSPEACLDFFRVISEDYDVSIFEEVMELIAEGSASPDHLAAFVVRWNLQDKWTFNIKTPQHKSVRTAIARATGEAA